MKNPFVGLLTKTNHAVRTIAGKIFTVVKHIPQNISKTLEEFNTSFASFKQAWNQASQDVEQERSGAQEGEENPAPPEKISTLDVPEFSLGVSDLLLLPQ